MTIKIPQYNALRAIAAIEVEDWMKDRALSISAARTPRSFYFYMMKKGVGLSLINDALEVFDLKLEKTTFELASLIEHADQEKRLKEILAEGKNEAQTDDDQV